MASKNKIKRKKKNRRRQQSRKYLNKLDSDRKHLAAIQRVLDALGLPNLYRGLPKKEHQFIMKFRMGAIRLELAEGIRAPRRLLNLMRGMISVLFKKSQVPVMPGCGNVTIEDYFTAGFTLYFFANREEENYTAEGRQAQQQLIPFVNTVGVAGSEPMMSFLTNAYAIGSTFSRVNQRMYYLAPEIYSNHSVIDLNMSASLKLHSVKAVTKKVTIDGKARPAYRVGWPLPSVGMEWTKISASDLGKDGSLADLPMDVYIQSHALIRMRQRLDTMAHSHIHVSIRFAFQRREVVPQPGNRALVALYFGTVKLGYFLVEIVTGIVVVRTFLFVTNSGTPEGKRLDQVLSAGKADKKYMEIDKLSTFVKSDITQDERVKKIFVKAGLKDLCTIDPEKFGVKDPLIPGYAAEFVKYMNLE